MSSLCQLHMKEVQAKHLKDLQGQEAVIHQELREELLGGYRRERVDASTTGGHTEFLKHLTEQLLVKDVLVRWAHCFLKSDFL